MIVPTFPYVRVGVYFRNFLHLMHLVHALVFWHFLEGDKQAFEITIVYVCARARVCVCAFLHFNFELLLSSHGTCFKLQVGALLFKVSKNNMVAARTYEAVATLAIIIVGVWGDVRY